MSSVTQPGTVVQPDDNLISGQTYTFSFRLGNWFSLPSENAVAAEITNYAPDFIGNVQVKQASGLSPLTNYFDITFTYHGDGSDVASDVAQEFVSAFAQGGDKFSLESMNMGSVGLSAASDIGQITGGIGSTVGAGVGNLLSQTLSGLGTGWTIVLVLGLIAVILVETGGVRAMRDSA